MERRAAADRAGRGLLLQPHHRRRLRADQLQQLRRQHHEGRGHRRHHVGPDRRQALADHGEPGRLHPPGAHLEGHRRQGGPLVRERAHRGPADRRGRSLRPDRPGEGPVHPVQGQPRLLRRPAGGRRAHVPGLQERRRRRPGAAQGRDRLRRRDAGQRLRRHQGRAGDHGGQRRVLRLQRDRDERGCGPGRWHPHRRRQPRAEGQAGAPGDQPRDRPPDAGRQGGRVRHAGQHDHPAAVRRPAPAADHALRLRPGQGRPAARRGRLPRGRRRQARRSRRRAPDPAPARPPGVPDLAADGAVRRGVAGGDRHHRRHDHRHRGHADRAQRRGPLRPVRVGLGRRARSRLPAVDLHLRPALLEGRRHHLRGAVGLALLQRGVRHALRRAGAGDRPGQARGDRQGDAADHLRRGALRRDVLLRPAAGLPIRQVHQLRPAAQGRRTPALPVRHVVLPVDHPGRGRRRPGRGIRPHGTGVSPALLAGLGALVAAGIAAVVLVARRRSSDEDTE